MTGIPLSKDSSNPQKTIDDFSDYYRARYPLSKGHTLPIILIHVGRATLFVISCLIISSIVATFHWEGRFVGVAGVILAILLFCGMNAIYAKLIKTQLKKGGYLEEADIVLGYVQSIAKELNMGENLTVLLKEEEFAKTPEVIMETKHIQIPFDEPMVVVQTDRVGNKFYLSSDGPELMVDIVRTK